MAVKKPKKQAVGAPAWMVTFSDMVTLLLTFFVLMLSMAQLDQMKFQDAAGSLRDAFGLMQGGSSTELSKPKIVEFVPIQDDFPSRLYQRIFSQINRLRIDDRITLVKDRGAVVLRIQETILFEPGKVELRPEAYPVLREIAGLIRTLPLNLRIEGHTDATPPASGQSNWDISVGRAVSVLKFIAGEELLPLERLSAVGYGAQRPLDQGVGPEAMARNRRVEFVLESIGGDREGLPYLIDARDQLPF